MRSLFCLFVLLLYVAVVRNPVVAYAAGQRPSIVWLSDLQQAFIEADKRQTLIILDITADWCAPCVQLERVTFASPMVIKKLESFTTVRIDVTDNNRSLASINNHYKVPGLPAILFLRPNGEEIPNSRIHNYLEPADFIRHLQALQQREFKGKR